MRSTLMSTRAVPALARCLVLILVAAACVPSGGGQPAGTPAGLAPTSAPQATKAATTAGTPAATATGGAPAGTGCFADIPVYPGSRSDKGKESDLQGLVKVMGGQSDWFVGEARVYMTSATPDQVLQFYKDGLPQQGWKQSSSIPGKNWGFVRWTKGIANAQLLTGVDSSGTIVLLGCSVTPPTPTPMVFQKMTMKEAFNALRQQSALSDVAFYGYEGLRVDQDGKTVQFTISGYSRGQKRFCYIRSEAKGAELTCRDQATMTEPLVDDLGKLKDSPELVSEAFKKYTTCPSGVNVAVNLVQSKAQFLCSESKWSGDVSPYK